MELQLNGGDKVPISEVYGAEFSYYSLEDLDENFISRFCANRIARKTITFGLSQGHGVIISIHVIGNLYYELHPTKQEAQERIDFINNLVKKNETITNSGRIDWPIGINATRRRSTSKFPRIF